MSFLFSPSSSASSAPAPRRRAARRSTVRDGAIVTKFFNPVAGRPYPPVGRLTDSITVQMTGVSTPFLTTSTTVPTYASTSFNIASFGGYANYTALFDQYHIEQIEVWLEPVISGTTTVGYGELASCVDLDDANTPSSIGTVANHPGALVGQGSSARYHKWKPHEAIAAYSGVFTSFANIPSTWHDSASTGVEHYGFKVAAAPTSVALGYSLSFRARVSFRAPGIN